MSDSPEAPRHDPARTRFIGLSLFRLSGVLIAVFGLLVFTERFSFVAGDNARQMGAIVILVGFFQLIVVPRMLARTWRTPRSSDHQQ